MARPNKYRKHTVSNIINWHYEDVTSLFIPRPAVICIHNYHSSIILMLYLVRHPLKPYKISGQLKSARRFYGFLALSFAVAPENFRMLTYSTTEISGMQSAPRCIQ